MAITNDQFLQGLYIAYWGRPADPDGFYYWKAQQAELGFAGIAENFAASAEGQAAYAYFDAFYTYGADAITETMRGDFVEEIYQNLFNRAADAEGKAYWIEQLESGASTPGAFIANIVNAAVVGAGADYDTLLNKAIAAESFTSLLVETGLDWDLALSSEVAAIIASVDGSSDMDAIDDAIGDVVDGGGSGGDFTLTFGTDELTGTADNDTFTAGLVADLGGTVAASFQDDDVLDGGAGTDTLNVTFQGGDSSAARLNSIEVVNVRVTGTTATATIDAVDHVGGEQIWSDRSTSSATLVVNNAAADVTYGAKNTNANLTVNFAAATSTTLDLALTDAGTTANDVTVNTTVGVIDTVNIAATGENVVDIAGVGTAVETITVTGEGSVEILNASATALETIDASGNKGGVTIAVASSTLDLTVTGGAGADDVSVGSGDDVIDLGAGDDRVVFALGNFDGNDEVDGGAGTDTLSIDVADATNLDDTVHVNFEALSLSATATSTYTIDNDAFGFETITLEDDMGDITIDNFNGGELVVQDDQELGITVGSTGTADTITLTVDAGTAITIGASTTGTPYGLDVTDVETVNIATASADDDVTFAAIETDGVKTISFSGAGDVIVTDITDGDTTNDGTVKITNVDLTGQTGGFVMDANNLGYGTTFTLGDLGNVAVATTTNDYDFDGDGTDDASSQIILTAGVRDTVKFTSNFEGNVAIDATAATEFGGDVTDDRIDLSFFDITIDDLTFEDVTDGLLITSDAFDGQILLVGVTGSDVNTADFVF